MQRLRELGGSEGWLVLLPGLGPLLSHSASVDTARGFLWRPWRGRGNSHHSFPDGQLATSTLSGPGVAPLLFCAGLECGNQTLAPWCAGAVLAIHIPQKRGGGVGMTCPAGLWRGGGSRPRAASPGPCN